MATSWFSGCFTRIARRGYHVVTDDNIRSSSFGKQINPIRILVCSTAWVFISGKSYRTSAGYGPYSSPIQYTGESD